MAVNARFPRVTPESQGISSRAILEFATRAETELHEIHSFMLVRNGNVVAEGWWHPYAADLRHFLFSLTKSFTSTAVGLAVADGRLSLDEKVVSFFPDDLPADVSPNLAAMEVRHLLSMSTGHADDSMPFLERAADGNWIREFLARPVEFEPGTHFLYDTGASHILSAIVTQRTGQRLDEFLRPRLFEPLGVKGFTWLKDPRAIAIGGFGLSARTEDVAAFGQLYLQKGRWNGRQLVPEAWVDEATSRQMNNGDDPNNDWNQGYGYQFWRCRHGAYRGDGAFGQYCVVMPERHAVLAITSGLADMQPPLNLLWDVLLPAMCDEPLPEDPEAREELTRKLTSLAIPPVAGGATSPASARANGRTFVMQPNELGIKTMRFDFRHDGCTITTDRRTRSMEIGYGTWKRDRNSFFGQPFDVVASGAWESDETYRAVGRAILMPFHRTVTARFKGDRVEVAFRQNVDFGPIVPITLAGAAS